MPGVAYLYSEIGLPCVPIALNSGLLAAPIAAPLARHRAGRESLHPIPPGLDKRAFLARLRSVVEEETARLVAEGRKQQR